MVVSPTNPHVDPSILFVFVIKICHMIDILLDIIDLKMFF